MQSNAECIDSPAATRDRDDGGSIRNVLVVDDSRAQRQLLLARLSGASFTVFEAASGAEALAICRNREIDLILSDWIMPGMSGIEFCRRLRGLPLPRYVYFILLTSNSDKAAVSTGLGVGADDFLIKPVDAAELLARIKAGERLLRLERELRHNNDLLSKTLAALHDANAAMDHDLSEARHLQQSLVRERARSMAEGEISLLLRPSGHVGGDMVGFFDIRAGLTGVFSFDVSGHGVTSALLAARIAGLLSGASPEQNIAIEQGSDGQAGRDPARVAGMINRIMLTEIQTERYLTLAYAEIDRQSGAVRLVQAGHPHPLVITAAGPIRTIGVGGLPIGLIEAARFETVLLQLNPGDRLLLVSDGVTECTDPDGRELGQQGLEDILHRHRGLPGRTLLDALIWELARWHGSEDFSDDISLALFDYAGVRNG